LTTRRVTTPNGVEWKVRRRWIPHREGKGIVERFRTSRQRRKENGGGAEALADLGGVDFGFEGLALAVGLIALILLLLLFGWPLVLIGVDLIWLLGAGTLGLLGRLVLGRPWRVEAVSTVERRTWHVQGFRSAGLSRDDLAAQLSAGINPAGTD
jgi:hypothetical protein